MAWLTTGTATATTLSQALKDAKLTGLTVQTMLTMLTGLPVQTMLTMLTGLTVQTMLKADYSDRADHDDCAGRDHHAEVLKMLATPAMLTKLTVLTVVTISRTCYMCAGGADHADCAGRAHIGRRRADRQDHALL